MDAQLSASNSQNSGILSRLILDLRGSRFVIGRETLMNLPESVLLCLFPNGLVLSRNNNNANNGGGGMMGEEFEGQGEEDEEEVYMVDFDPACLSYVLSFFKSAQDDFYGTPSTPGRYRTPLSTSNSLGSMDAAQQAAAMQQQQANGAAAAAAAAAGGNPLLSKQAIIVLREELEYFAIPKKPGPSLKQQRENGSRADLPLLQPIDYNLPTAQEDLARLEAAYEPPEDQETTNLVTGAPTRRLLELKHKAGQALLDRKHIFTALQRNVNKENNLAEQHLIDMLCMSGFDRSDTWGFRAVEPNRCCITSIALVLLKTGIVHAGDAKGQQGIAEQAARQQQEGGVAAQGIDPQQQQQQQYVDGPNGMKIDQNQLATAQKLLLFWRKPARKCWWDGVDIVVPLESDEDPIPTGETPDANAAARAVSGVPGSEASPNAGMTPEEVALLKSGKGRKVRVWARRVWTLELSLI